MKGWQIFVHSLRQVTGNFDAALKVSGLLYLVQIALTILLLGSAALYSGGAGTAMTMAAGFGFGALIVFAVVVVTSLWIAVGWHRYVLLGEASAGLPTFRADRMWAYFLRSLGYALIIILVGIVLGTVVGFLLRSFLSGPPFAIMVLLGLLVYVPMLVVAFRLTAALPAAALGVETPFTAGWNATAGQTGDLISLALILVFIGLAITLIGHFVFGGIAVLATIWQFVIGWLQMIVGVSVLTTLYGHYIQKRPLV